MKFIGFSMDFYDSHWKYCFFIVFLKMLVQKWWFGVRFWQKVVTLRGVFEGHVTECRCFTIQNVPPWHFRGTSATNLRQCNALWPDPDVCTMCVPFKPQLEPFSVWDTVREISLGYHWNITGISQEYLWNIAGYHCWTTVEPLLNHY